MNDDLVYIKALQEYMLKNGITQNELAERLQVSPAAVGKWLLGHNGITRRNRDKIRRLCGNLLSDPAAAFPEAPEETKNMIRTMVTSLQRTALGERSGDAVKGAIEEFRNLAILAVMDIEMPAELRTKIIRAISNIEYEEPK